MEVPDYSRVKRLPLTDAEVTWLKLIYDHFEKGFNVYVENAIQRLFDRGEWVKGFDPYSIDPRLLREANRITLLGVWHVEPESRWLEWSHRAIAHVKGLIESGSKPRDVATASVRDALGLNTEEQVSKIVQLIWNTGGFMYGKTNVARQGQLSAPNWIPIYQSFNVFMPEIYEEYERYQDLPTLFQEALEEGGPEGDMSSERQSQPLILGRYPLMKPLVGFHSEIEARLERQPFEKNVFMMMKFRESNKVLSDHIKEVLEGHDLKGVRADDPEWNITNNVYNPLAVLYCCKYGIALFDEKEEGAYYSPNVAYELGIMHYQQKNCLILRHAELPPAPFDLVKDLYKPYSRDLQVRQQINQWIIEITHG